MSARPDDEEALAKLEASKADREPEPDHAPSMDRATHKFLHRQP